MTPAKKPANKNASKDPKVAIATKTIAVKPAAGPETLSCEPLNKPTTIPPTTPEIIPENKGAPLARAIPKHNGSATRKTTNPDFTSDLKYFVEKFFMAI